MFKKFNLCLRNLAVGLDCHDIYDILGECKALTAYKKMTLMVFSAMRRWNLVAVWVVSELA